MHHLGKLGSEEMPFRWGIHCLPEGRLVAASILWVGDRPVSIDDWDRGHASSVVVAFHYGLTFEPSHRNGRRVQHLHTSLEKRRPGAFSRVHAGAAWQNLGCLGWVSGRFLDSRAHGFGGKRSSMIGGCPSP